MHPGHARWLLWPPTGYQRAFPPPPGTHSCYQTATFSAPPIAPAPSPPRASRPPEFPAATATVFWHWSKRASTPTQTDAATSVQALWTTGSHGCLVGVHASLSRPATV